MPLPEDESLEIVKQEIDDWRKNGPGKYGSLDNNTGQLLRFIDTLITEIDKLKERVDRLENK